MKKSKNLITEYNQFKKINEGAGAGKEITFSAEVDLYIKLSKEGYTIDTKNIHLNDKLEIESYWEAFSVEEAEEYFDFDIEVDIDFDKLKKEKIFPGSNAWNDDIKDITIEELIEKETNPYIYLSNTDIMHGSTSISFVFSPGYLYQPIKKDEKIEFDLSNSADLTTSTADKEGEIISDQYDLKSIKLTGVITPKQALEDKFRETFE